MKGVGYYLQDSAADETRREDESAYLGHTLPVASDMDLDSSLLRVKTTSPSLADMPILVSLVFVAIMNSRAVFSLCRSFLGLKNMILALYNSGSPRQFAVRSRPIDLR